MHIDHVLLTRFNLPTEGVESLVRAQDGWLRNRQILFERYCLPAVASQTEQNFKWIIYFDTQSPEWLCTRIAELERLGLFTAIYRDEVPHDVLVEDIRKVTGASGDVLLTSNLDNDDGLAVDFVYRLQTAVKDDERVAMYLVNGLIQQGGNLYLRKDPINAFCSVAESWNGPSTCWSDWHTKLGRQMRVIRLGGAPGWLQVIHSGNVSNRVRGFRVSPRSYIKGFAVGVDEVAEPSVWDKLVDRWVLGPARSSRDSVRKLGKNLILSVAGKKGLDTFKSLLAGGASSRVL